MRVGIADYSINVTSNRRIAATYIANSAVETSGRSLPRRRYLLDYAAAITTLPRGKQFFTSDFARPPQVARRSAIRRQRGHTWPSARSVLGHDFEGIVAKRPDDPYESNVRWLQIENPDYSQKAGRGELFNPPRRG